MRTLKLLALVALAVPFVPRAARAEVKIGYVDLQRALNEVEEGRVAKAQLKKDFDEKQKRLDREQEDLKRMKADLDKQSVVMSDDAKKQKQSELDRKVMEVQGLFMSLQKELSEREREVTRGIFDKMNAIIREIADNEGFTVVFEKNDAGILFALNSMDLTPELVRAYNKNHPVGQGKPKPASAGKPAAANDKAKK